MIEQLTAGIDWLTLTLPADAPMDQAWLGAGHTALLDIAAQGERIGPRSMLGYIGSSSGNCFVGTRDDGHMMQFTGRYADQAFKSVYRADCNVSRIDVQVTVKHDVMPLYVAGKGYRDALNHNNSGQGTKARKLYVIMGSDGGQTLYVGAPSSDQRGRLYNKEVQSEDPRYARTWRYETVLRNERATAISRILAAQEPDYTYYVSSFVALWWEGRGITAPWSADETIELLPPLKTLPTDIERSLAWLEHQVAPTVRLLIERGYRDTLLAALGLDPRGHATGE